MKRFQAAQLVNYNANNRGSHVGDCVKRSLSLAFDIPYSKVGQILNAKMHELRKTRWNALSVFEPVIKELGGTDFIPMDDKLTTLEEFADNIAEPGRTYILLVGKKYGERSHMVAVRDKKIWDSWNSKNQIVTGYYLVKESTPQKELTDIKEHLPELRTKYAIPTIEDEVRRYMGKKAWEGELRTSSKIKDYAIVSQCTLILAPDYGLFKKARTYTFKVNLTIEPTMTEDEAIQFIETVGKQRTYDRMYAINEQEKKLIEALKIKAKLGTDDKEDYVDTGWMSEQERKFLNALPGWTRPLVMRVSIDRPGWYRNSYEITLRKLPGDDIHPDIDRFTLEDYDAAGIKEQLDTYKKTYDIGGIDYYPDR